MHGLPTKETSNQGSSLNAQTLFEIFLRMKGLPWYCSKIFSDGFYQTHLHEEAINSAARTSDNQSRGAKRDFFVVRLPYVCVEAPSRAQRYDGYTQTNHKEKQNSSTTSILTFCRMVFTKSCIIPQLSLMWLEEICLSKRAARRILRRSF